MNSKISLQIGAFLGALGVAIGAFGAHGLAPYLESIGRAETFEIAVKYQFYHALALVLMGILLHQKNNKSLRLAALLFVIGIIIFSGSLYIICFTGITQFGMVAPIGGLSLIAAWLMLLVGVK